MYAELPDSIDRTLALALASLGLFVLANVFPFMTFSLEGQVSENRIITGVLELWAGGSLALAVLIFSVSILAPLIKILLLLYLMVPLKLGRVPWGLARSYRLYEGLREWGMLEVYMLGVMVAIIKLTQMATIVMGVAFYSFAALMLTTTASGAALDPRIVWARLAPRGGAR